MTLDNMFERGIMNSTADYWVHLFPLISKVFWYRVEHCQEFIRTNNPPITPGKSKDGTTTGAGYLVPQNTYFVSDAVVPRRYLEHTDWPRLTDNEAGFLGERVMSALIEHRVVQFPALRAEALRDRGSQFSSRDLTARYMGAFTIELKTERKTTNNLFVQLKERGHRVHLVKDADGQVSERYTQPPGFDGEMP